MDINDTTSGGGADTLDDLFVSDGGKPQPVAKPQTIPDKYQGKSIEDIIQMHQNSEAALSRQGSELGTLRRLSDRILELEKSPATRVTEERKPVTVDALLNDPEKAIQDAVDNSAAMRRAEAAEKRANALEASITERDFVTKHANFADDIKDPKFNEWVSKSQIRQGLAQRAGQKDYLAANELWNLYDEYKELTGGSTGETRRDTAVTKTVPSGVRSTPASGVGAKQVWSRAKLMELREQVQDGNPKALARWNDPGFQDKMHLAYAEDRVR